jgi:hypothetical protein
MLLAPVFPRIPVQTTPERGLLILCLSRADLRGLPLSITVDHGSEFEGQVLDTWTYEADNLTPEPFAKSGFAA